jgi:DNA uptake protein ComE-like DNA-binding protein
MTRTALPLLILATLVLGACQAGVDEEMNPPEDTVSLDIDPVAPVGAEEGVLLDPGNASEADLRALGLDSATVAAIIAARPIENMLEVDAILAESMDEAERDAIYSRMFKPLDLNSASGEEIQLIPRVGDRMQHEFEEYRPYTDMAQFRREMGKYVDDQEVERLASYVTIRNP